jgi:hypothetical protein
LNIKGFLPHWQPFPYIVRLIEEKRIRDTNLISVQLAQKSNKTDTNPKGSGRSEGGTRAAARDLGLADLVSAQAGQKLNWYLACAQRNLANLARFICFPHALFCNEFVLSEKARGLQPMPPQRQGHTSPTVGAVVGFVAEFLADGFKLTSCKLVSLGGPVRRSNSFDASDFRQLSAIVGGGLPPISWRSRRFERTAARSWSSAMTTPTKLHRRKDGTIVEILGGP